MCIILKVIASVCLTAFFAFAQTNLGAITGSITDSAGALMPGVRIEAKNTGTDASYQVASSSTGTYTVGQLPAGTYQISVSVPGFKRYIRTGITVVEAQIIRIDIVLAMLSSEEILTNDSVIQLLKAGVDEDLIISKIQDTRHSFDVSVQGMVALKEGGVSDRLMHFLMDTSKAPEPKTPPVQARPAVAPSAPVMPPKETPKSAEIPAGVDSSLPKEVGVYVQAGKQWLEMQPEVVVWQTGGTLKRFVTAGIVQGDVNGRIKGAHSETVLKTPLEFLVVAPEGVTLAEYQLIHLREQRDAREFRTVTGGVFSSSGGATRDALPFEGTKVVSRVFSIKLSDLYAGEYGFLPTGGASPSSSSNVGKMFTFRLK
jgi:hypothetical protein